MTKNDDKQLLHFILHSLRFTMSLEFPRIGFRRKEGDVLFLADSRYSVVKYSPVEAGGMVLCSNIPGSAYPWFGGREKYLAKLPQHPSLMAAIALSEDVQKGLDATSLERKCGLVIVPDKFVVPVYELPLGSPGLPQQTSQ
ncbi:MAG: hypothetical protein H6502_00390 [Candidatus Woesearchaeota archaeon]|nr:MAG: hypothetical protein H6502_00390 [Candidatus Woesearchaeota archaeon]